MLREFWFMFYSDSRASRSGLFCFSWSVILINHLVCETRREFYSIVQFRLAFKGHALQIRDTLLASIIIYTYSTDALEEVRLIIAVGGKTAASPALDTMCQSCR